MRARTVAVVLLAVSLATVAGCGGSATRASAAAVIDTLGRQTFSKRGLSLAEALTSAITNGTNVEVG